MQECPTSPSLWSMAVFMEAPQQRKGKSVDALKKSNEHPIVIGAIARLFWAERKIEKTRQWMGNAITADPDWGDAWGWWLKFERQHGEPVSTSLLHRLAQSREYALIGCRNGKELSLINVWLLVRITAQSGRRSRRIWRIRERVPRRSWSL
jgi:hypothetical protein